MEENKLRKMRGRENEGKREWVKKSVRRWG